MRVKVYNKGCKNILGYLEVSAKNTYSFYEVYDEDDQKVRFRVVSMLINNSWGLEYSLETNLSDEELLKIPTFRKELNV